MTVASVELRILQQGVSGEVEQPRTITLPRRQTSAMAGIFISSRLSSGSRSVVVSASPLWICWPMLASLRMFRPSADGDHHSVLDAVGDHLDEVAGASRATMQKAFRRVQWHRCGPLCASPWRHRTQLWPCINRRRTRLNNGSEPGALDEQAMLLRAIEDKRFPPLGGDKEISSDFQLIAGTNRDLVDAVRQGRFRDDLFARLNPWTFDLPGLKERAQDIEPNLDFELERYARLYNEHERFNREWRSAYLRFATSPDAIWPGNFRDLGASITRIATLSEQGRITPDVVKDETTRLQRVWRGQHEGSKQEAEVLQDLLGDAAADLDRFDRVQLLEVVRVCRSARTLSAAGRILVQASREKERSSNDADRLRKYRQRFDLTFEKVVAAMGES